MVKEVMVRVIITGGLMLATIGWLVSMCSEIWGTVLVAAGLLMITVGVSADWCKFQG